MSKYTKTPFLSALLWGAFPKLPIWIDRYDAGNDGPSGGGKDEEIGRRKESGVSKKLS